MAAPAKPMAQKPPEPVPLPWNPRRAIAVVASPEHKWAVLELSIDAGAVTSVRVVEQSAHLDLAQDAARRAVLRLRA